MRSPAQFVATYTDPIDAQTPIYSLCPLGQQRFVIGGGRHCLLKVFDLRMARNWATYLPPPACRYPYGSESPVYALALAPSGRHVFAGTQGTVWELGFADGRGAGRREAGPMVYQF